nr:MFS transporter [Actinomyces ruminis]
MTAAPPGRTRPPVVVKARIAVYLTFLANGLGFSNLVPRYPEILEHLGITKAAFGRAVMFNSIGALVAGLAASWLIRRFTSARVAAFGMIVLGLGLLGAGMADSWIVFALCMAWVGGTDAIVDVAQNAHGLRVERRWGGSIITSFHAAWSLGAVLGATLGQAMAGAGVPVEIHMAGVLALLAAVSSAAVPWTIKGPDATTAAWPRPPRMPPPVRAPSPLPLTSIPTPPPPRRRPPRPRRSPRRW